jgi:hypothetical protein
MSGSAVQVADVIGDDEHTLVLGGESIERAILPLWFERGLVLVCAAVLSFGGFGLLFAFFGHYTMASAYLLGGAGTVVLTALSWRRLRPRGTPPARGGPAIAMCFIALASALWNGLKAGHFVAVDRDPGVYATAGRWLARTGTLEVHGGDLWSTFAGGHYNWASPGMYPEGNGRLEFQFNHFLPTLLAEAHDIGGDRLMFALPAVLGALALCAIFAVGSRLAGRPWLVLSAVVGLAVCLPQVAFSRDTYSETSTQFLLWAGLWLLLVAWDRRHLGVGLLAGLAIGGTVMSRVDALIYLAPLPILAAVGWLAAHDPEQRRSRLRLLAVILAGIVAPALLGSFDLVYRAGGYYTALDSEVASLRLLILVSVLLALVLVAVWPRLPAIRAAVVARRNAIGIWLGVIVATALLLAWSLRPAIQHSHWAANSTTAALQAIEGIPVDATRSYNELTMIWMSWYVGPVAVALAILGIALLIRAALNGSAAPLLVLAVAGLGAALYLWKPSNTPEQIWMMRRFVPAAMPLFVLAAAAGVDALIRASSRIGYRRPLARPITAAAAVVLIAFPLGVTWPVRNAQSQAGFLPTVKAACTAWGPDAVVAVAPADPDGTLLQTVRSWCGVPTTSLWAPLTAEQLGQISDAWHARGRTLWIAGSTPKAVIAAAPGLRNPRLLSSATNHEQLAYTLTHPPDNYQTETLVIYATRVGS